MRRSAEKLIHAFLVAIMVAAMVPQAVFGDDHVVPQSDLHQSLMDASLSRSGQISDIRRVFASGTAADVLRSAGIDARKVERAVAFLDDEDLARLSARARQLEADLAAGEISNRNMLYVLIICGVGALIALLVATG